MYFTNGALREVEREMTAVPGFSARPFRNGAITQKRVKDQYRLAVKKLMEETACKELKQRLCSLPYPTHTASHCLRLKKAAAELSCSIDGTPDPLWAALYLVTATTTLWERTRDAIFRLLAGSRLQGISQEEYILFQAAKTLLTGREKITDDELGDPSIVSDRALVLIVTARLVTRYGAWLLPLLLEEGG